MFHTLHPGCVLPVNQVHGYSYLRNKMLNSANHEDKIHQKDSQANIVHEEDSFLCINRAFAVVRKKEILYNSSFGAAFLAFVPFFFFFLLLRLAAFASSSSCLFLSTCQENYHLVLENKLNPRSWQKWSINPTYTNARKLGARSRKI